MKKDIQRKRWLLTVNNPEEHGLDHGEIKKRLIEGFPTLGYLAMADEKGSTYHTHMFIYFKSRVRFSTLKKRFPSAHIEAAKGTTSECLAYLKKEGKWLDDESKREQRLEGTFEEWGEKPPEKGHKDDMAELYRMIKDGYSNIEILDENPDYIRYLEKMDKLRTMTLIEKYKGHRRLDLKVVYISGATGSGKTRGVLDEHGDGKVFKVSDYKHPFDNYACQEVLAFEEFRSQIPIADMLQYCDVYPIELPARYSNKVLCAETIYILSNRPLEWQYEDVQRREPESWKSFLRRIHEVRVHGEDGSVQVFDSVKAYMERETQDFTPMGPNETMPW